MNIKNILKLYFFLCLFPSWILSENVLLNEKFYFIIPFTIIYILLIFFYQKESQSRFKLVILSLVTVYSFDQNLSFNSNIIQPNFNFLDKYLFNIFIGDFLLLIIVFFMTIFITFALKKNAIKIFFSFMFVIFIFKISDTIFKPINIINYDNSESLKSEYIDEKKTIIIILDEMSGINSSEKNYKYGKEFNDQIINFAKKNDLRLYTDTFSISDNTGNSVSFLLNFQDSKPTKSMRYSFITETNKSYNDYSLKKNKFFDNYNNISVIQNIHLNFCNQLNVKKCYQFNPYKKNNNNLSGAKNNIFSKFFSLWRIDGSSFAKITWKILMIVGVIDSVIEPVAHKIFLPLIFEKIKNDTILGKFDLVFAHILAPHIPYGFNKDCSYDGKKSSFNTLMNYKEKIIQHNVERICMIKILDNFFNDIKNLTNFEKLDIIILSDHGSRISSKENFSTIFLSKINDKKFEFDKRKISIQELFTEIFFKK